MLQDFCYASGRTDNNWLGFTVSWYKVISSTFFFFWANLNWENQLNCISCFHLMAVLYLIINRRPIVSPVCSVVSLWHFQWSVAVVLGAVLVNAGGGGIGGLHINKRTRTLAARMDRRAVLEVPHIPWVLGHFSQTWKLTNKLEWQWWCYPQIQRR